MLHGNMVTLANLGGQQNVSSCVPRPLICTRSILLEVRKLGVFLLLGVVCRMFAQGAEVFRCHSLLGG